MNKPSVVFDLGTILSVITRKLFTDIGNLYEILNYMTGDDLFTHQLPRVSEEMAPIILEQYPQLANIDASGANPKNWKDFLEEQKKIYGNYFPIQPCGLFQHKHIDAMEEAEQIAPGKVCGVTTDILENKEETDRPMKHLRGKNPDL